MHRIRRLIRQWLGFSRTETNGFLVLLPLMILLIMSEPMYRWWASSQSIDFSADARYLDSLAAVLQVSESPVQTVSEPSAAAVKFRQFDPNKVTSDDLKSLGFSEILSTRIANYRAKGGVFRVKADLLKMYGMDSTFYHQLYPYILLPDKPEKQKSGKTFEPYNRPGVAARKELEPFDLNKADTATLKTIKGIGPALAARIVKFRHALGGFVNKQQIREIYGLDTAVIRKLERASFIENGFEPVKIDLNTSDEKTLDAHPYMTKTAARAIIAYKYQHGSFTDKEQIRNISIITPENAEKLLPYLKTEK